MTRKLCWLLLALSFIAVSTSTRDAYAQTRTIIRNGVRYDVYGQGYYGGYAQGYNGAYTQGYNGGYGQGYTVYSPRSYNYTGYGYGPYSYGAANTVQVPANSVYSYGNQTYYNGYGYPANSGQYQYNVPTYSPYGYVRPYAYGNRW
jgi:hypothetical protein